MTLSYRFTVDPAAYAKGHGIEIKDKGNEGAETGAEQKPAGENDNGEAQKADSAVAQDEANDSQRPVSECNANNPVTCPYHGMQLIQHEIEERVHAILPEAQITLTRPVRGLRNTYDLQINFNGRVTPAQQRRVARAMDQFFNGAGVTEDHVEGETTRRGHSSMFDIDELDPHYGEGRGTTVEHRDDAGRNRAVPPAEGRRLAREAAAMAIREGIRRREQARAEALRRQAEEARRREEAGNGNADTNSERDKVISHDGIALEKGMRVAWNDNSGLLFMGTIIGFKFGLARIKTDDGWEVIKGGANIYAR